MIAEDQDERVLGFSHTISDTILKQGMDEQSKSHRRKGAGGGLMNHLEKTASELGAKIVTVHATLNTVEFYRKCGFDSLKFVKHRVSD